MNREGIIDPSSLVARSSIAGYMLRHLAHLADSNHNSESAANSKRFSFLLSVDQKMQRRGEEGGGGILHCPHIIVWEHHFSTAALLYRPQEAHFSNSNHYVMEAAAGQG